MKFLLRSGFAALGALALVALALVFASRLPHSAPLDVEPLPLATLNHERAHVATCEVCRVIIERDKLNARP